MGRCDLEHAGLRRDPGRFTCAQIAHKIVDAWNRDNPGVPFRVVPTPPYFAIAAANSLLDTPTTIALAARLPSETLQAIANAITQSTRVFVTASSGMSMGLDSTFTGQPGRIPEAWNSRSFVTWGAQRTPARAALADLLKQSSTTMTWRLMCLREKPSMGAQCVLNVDPVRREFIDKQGRAQTCLVTFDRKHVRVPIPPPPPTREMEASLSDRNRPAHCR